MSPGVPACPCHPKSPDPPPRLPICRHILSGGIQETPRPRREAGDCLCYSGDISRAAGEASLWGKRGHSSTASAVRPPVRPLSPLPIWVHERSAHHAAPPLLGQMSSFVRGQPHHVGPLGKPRKRKQASHFGVRWPVWPREPTPSCLSPRTAPLVGSRRDQAQNAGYCCTICWGRAVPQTWPLAHWTTWPSPNILQKQSLFSATVTAVGTSYPTPNCLWTWDKRRQSDFYSSCMS